MRRFVLRPSTPLRHRVGVRRVAFHVCRGRAISRQDGTIPSGIVPSGTCIIFCLPSPRQGFSFSVPEETIDKGDFCSAHIVPQERPRGLLKASSLRRWLAKKYKKLCGARRTDMAREGCVLVVWWAC